MAHAAILTGGCPVILITVAKTFFSFSGKSDNRTVVQLSTRG